MTKKTLLDSIIESVKRIDNSLDKRDGAITQAISDLNYKVVEPAKSAADSAVAYANEAIEKSQVNSQAIDDINSAVSDAVSDAAVARSDGLRAWNAAQSNVNLIDLNYASASAAISSARTEAIAAADEAKKSASAAQADIVSVRSDVAVVQADVTATRSDVATAESAIADTKTSLSSQATSLSSYAAQASANGTDITTLKSQAGQIEQDMASTKGDVSQLKVSASAASVTLSDAAGNISSLQATATSYSAALSDTNSNVASVTATASELETKYADAAGDINQIKTGAKGMTQTISDAQGDIAKLKTRADGFDAEFADTKGDISKLQTDATGTTQTLANTKSDVAVLQSWADGFDAKYANAAGDINTLKTNASGFSQTLVSAKGDISTLQATANGLKNTLTDAQGNISTLQSDVSGLKKTTSDNAGNIATLQANAKTLTSQMSSAQGDISTLKQTASDFSSKVSGMETSLSDANGKINDITSNGGGRNLITGTSRDLQTASDSPSQTLGGQIYYFSSNDLSSLAGNQVTARAFIHNTTNHTVNLVIWTDGGGFGVGTGVPAGTDGYSTITSYSFTSSNTSGDISVRAYTENAAISGVQYKELKLEKGIVAHDWQPAPEDTDAKITANTTAIEQNKQAIVLKADQTTVDKTNGTVQQLQSQLQVQADQIASKVSSSDLPKLVGGGGRNLAIGTDVKKCDGPRSSADGGQVSLDTWKSLRGQWVTISCDMSWTGFTRNTKAINRIGYEVALGYSDGTQLYISNWYTPTDSEVNKSFRYSASWQLPDKELTAIDEGSLFNQIDATTCATSKLMIEKGTVAHDWQPAPEDTQEYTQTQIKQTSDSLNANLASVKDGLTQSYTNLSATVGGIQAQVYNSDGTSKITQLSNLIATKVSQGDYNSQITQLQNDINLRVTKGDVVSQINEEAGGNTLIQVSNGKGSFILNADNTIMTGKAWIPDAAIGSISADKIMLGSSALWNSDGTLNLVNQSNNLKALMQVKQGLVQNTTQSIISFASDYNTRAFSITPVGATVTPTLFFERYDQAPDHWLGFTRNEVEREGIEFNTWDNEGERFFVDCHARFHKNLSTEGIIYQGSWDNTTGKPLAGILSIETGNTIWSGSGYLAVGDHVSNSYTNVIAKSFSQQSTLSSKTNIEEVDPKDALYLINQTDIRSYQYKSDVAQGKTKRYTSLIIDDVNDVSQYCAPDAFVNEERTGRDDGSAVGYLFLAVKELTRRIKTLEEKLNG